MTAKIYQLRQRVDEPGIQGDDPQPANGDGGGPPQVIEIRIILEAPDLPDEPEPDPEPKQRTWPWFLGGALLGALLGG